MLDFYVEHQHVKLKSEAGVRAFVPPSGHRTTSFYMYSTSDRTKEALRSSDDFLSFKTSFCYSDKNKLILKEGNGHVLQTTNSYT